MSTTPSPAASDAAKAAQASARAASSSASSKAPVDALFAALLDQALIDPTPLPVTAEAMAVQTGSPDQDGQPVEAAEASTDPAWLMAQLGLAPGGVPAPSLSGTPVEDGEAAPPLEVSINAAVSRGLGRAPHLSAIGLDKGNHDSPGLAMAGPHSAALDDIPLAGKPGPTSMTLAQDRPLQAMAAPVDPTLLATAADEGAHVTSSASNPIAASQPPSLNTLRPEALPNLPALPVQHPAFGQRLGETVNWMVNRGLQEADIRISPENLGPVRIKLRMEGQDAVVSFVVPQDSTREAIEQNLEALRQALSQAGLTLGETTVSAHSGQQTGSGQGQSGHQRQTRAEAADSEPSVAAVRRIGVPAGRVDLFA
jgi:flagellar hook-length control protein FliK